MTTVAVVVAEGDVGALVDSKAVVLVVALVAVNENVRG